MNPDKDCEQLYQTKPNTLINPPATLWSVSHFNLKKKKKNMKHDLVWVLYVGQRHEHGPSHESLLPCNEDIRLNSSLKQVITQ